MGFWHGKTSPLKLSTGIGVIFEDLVTTFHLEKRTIEHWKTYLDVQKNALWPLRGFDSPPLSLQPSPPRRIRMWALPSMWRLESNAWNPAHIICFSSRWKMPWSIQLNLDTCTCGRRNSINSPNFKASNDVSCCTISMMSCNPSGVQCFRIHGRHVTDPV